MPRVEFEADTIEEVLEMARHWVAAYPVSEGLEDVLKRITSPTSRRLLAEIAAQSLNGRSLVVDDALLGRLGVADRTGLVGVLGVPNRTMRRRAFRDLVIPDRDTRGYRMANDDARVVLQTFGAPA